MQKSGPDKSMPTKVAFGCVWAIGLALSQPCVSCCRYQRWYRKIWPSVTQNYGSRVTKEWPKTTEIYRANKAASDEIRMTSLRCCLPLTMPKLTFRHPLGLLLQKNDVWWFSYVASFACSIVSSARQHQLLWPSQTTNWVSQLRT